jgi:hypothetical protein
MDDDRLSNSLFAIAQWATIVGIGVLTYRSFTHTDRKDDVAPRPSAKAPAAAGWYADPWRRYPGRYFDGTHWTSQVQTSDGTVQRDG